MFANPKQSLAEAYAHEARETLKHAQETIVHCIHQLDDEQADWRPFGEQKSIANIVLHLCGNVRQWIISGVGGEPDTRHRASEFSDRRKYPRAELLERLAKAVREAEEVIGQVDAQELTQGRRVQGFDATVLGLIFHSVSHFVGHSQEIVYITRLLLREKYKFKFVPATKEQGAP